jgi:hypothetical protein
LSGDAGCLISLTQPLPLAMRPELGKRFSQKHMRSNRDAAAPRPSLLKGDAEVAAFGRTFSLRRHPLKSASETQVNRCRRPFGVAILPRSSGHGRRHGAGLPSRRKREGARVLGRDRAPFLAENARDLMAMAALGFPLLNVRKDRPRMRDGERALSKYRRLGKAICSQADLPF